MENLNWGLHGPEDQSQTRCQGRGRLRACGRMSLPAYSQTLTRSLAGRAGASLGWKVKDPALGLLHFLTTCSDLSVRSWYSEIGEQEGSCIQKPQHVDIRTLIDRKRISP